MAIDDEAKVIYVTINKPQGKVYSLSDKIVQKVDGGYRVVVTLPDCMQEITKESRWFKEETVPSKYGLEPWHRYWYQIKPGDTDGSICGNSGAKSTGVKPDERTGRQESQPDLFEGGKE